jgi:hypothetical protein
VASLATLVLPLVVGVTHLGGQVFLVGGVIGGFRVIVLPAGRGRVEVRVVSSLDQNVLKDVWSLNVVPAEVLLVPVNGE